MLFLYIIFWGILLRYFWKNGWNPSTFLISLYLISSISSIILLYGYDTFDENRISFKATVYHIFTLMLCTYPILRFGDIKMSDIVFPSFSRLNILAWMLIVTGTTGSIVFFVQIINMLKIGNFWEARMLFLQDEENMSSRNIFEFIGRIGGCLSFVSVFLGFYYYKFEYKFKALLLFVSSISTIIINAIAAGRHAVIFWLFSIIFSYLVFKDNLHIKQSKIVRNILALPSIIFLFYFTLVTIDRFKESEGGIIYELVCYAGQPNIYFSYGYDLFFENTFHGRKSFGYLFPANERIPALNLNDYYTADYHLNTFSTFIGTIYKDIGNANTLVFSLLFFSITAIAFRTKQEISFFTLCFYLFCFELVAQGVFIFLHSSSTSIKSYALLLLIAFIMSYIFPSKNKQLNVDENG